MIRGTRVKHHTGIVGVVEYVLPNIVVIKTEHGEMHKVRPDDLEIIINQVSDDEYTIVVEELLKPENIQKLFADEISLKDINYYQELLGEFSKMLGERLFSDIG